MALDDDDPGEPFNEQMFDFNYTLDRRVVKPTATGWSTVVLPTPRVLGIAKIEGIEPPDEEDTGQTRRSTGSSPIE